MAGMVEWLKEFNDDVAQPLTGVSFRNAWIVRMNESGRAPLKLGDVLYMEGTKHLVTAILCRDAVVGKSDFWDYKIEAKTWGE